MPRVRGHDLVQTRDLHRSVGALGQRRVEDLVDLVLIDGNNGHLAAVRFLELERLLDRVVVELVDPVAQVVALEVGTVVVDLELLDEVGGQLDGYCDVHAVRRLVPGGRDLVTIASTRPQLLSPKTGSRGWQS
jgi:hypothetical protein